jgi:hypothetical protein
MDCNKTPLLVVSIHFCSGNFLVIGLGHSVSFRTEDILGLQNVLREKYGTWASNGSSVEEIWNSFNKIVSDNIESFVPHKIFRRKP